MNYFECYICLERIAEVYAQQPCESQKHLCCTICYNKLVNKATCPVCRQKNPMWVELPKDDDSDSDFDDFSTSMINYMIDREAM